MLQFLGVNLSGLLMRHRYRKVFKLDAQRELTEKTQRNANKHPKKCSSVILENELKCVCLNARTIVNNVS